MKTFKEIHDEDIFNNCITPDGEYTLRPTVKAIVVDEQNNIAIMKSRHYLLPGGGVEKGETNIEAIKREIMEEVGCRIENIQEVGTSHQFRNKTMKHYEVIFFVAKVLGEKGEPTTLQEDELTGVEVLWLDRDTLFTILKSQTDIKDLEEYSLCFNARSHFQAFEEYFTSS